MNTYNSNTAPTNVKQILDHMNIKYVRKEPYKVDQMKIVDDSFSFVNDSKVRQHIQDNVVFPQSRPETTP
jgi:hypothetical protein